MKRFLSIILTIVMLVLPMAEMTVLAAPSLAQTGDLVGEVTINGEVEAQLLAATASSAEARIEELKELFPSGSFFSVDGKACSHTSSETCSNCNLVNILKREDLEDYRFSDGGSYTCLGFAKFAWYFIHGKVWSGSYDVIINQGTPNKDFFSQAVPGDMIYFFGSSGNFRHAAIFCSASDTSAVVYHANTGGVPNKVNCGSWSYSSMSSYYGSGSYARLLRIKGYVPEQTFTVSFDANGGTGAPSSQTASDGSTITLSTTVPTRSGYTFLGWSTSSSATSTSCFPGSSYEVTGDTTLYAVWSNVTNWTSWSDWRTTSSSAKTYRQVEIKQQYGYYHYVLTWSDIVGAYPINNTTMMSNGYSSASEQYHEHWSDVKLSADATGRLIYQVNGESKLYDKYPNNCCTLSGAPTISSINHLYSMGTTRTLYRTRTAKYTVAYNANGGSGAPANQTKTHGVNLTLSSTKPTRAGYTFKGWATSSGGSVEYASGAAYSANANITLYAVWQKNVESLTANSSNIATITTGGEMAYYEFTTNEQNYYVIYSMGSEDTIVCLYDENGNEIDFDDDDGDDTNFFLLKCLDRASKYTYAIGFNSPTKTGEIAFNFGKQFQIIYHENGGMYTTDVHPHSIKYYGKDHIIHNIQDIPLIREGYTFKGWATSADATVAEYLPGDTYTTNASTALYAVWEADTYTVTYNANGGSGAPSSQTKTHGVNLTLSTTKPTRSGYTFKGWGTTATGNVVYNPGSSYTENKDITLYAIWQSDAISVTGITLNKTSASLNIGETVTLTATVNPSNASDKSVTWTSSNTDVATVENGTVTAVGAGSATITAKTADGAKKATCFVTVVDPDAPCEVFIYTESSKKTAVLGSEFTFTLSLSGTYDGYSVDIPKNFASGLTVTGVDAADGSDITDFDDKYMVSVLGGKGRVDSEKTTVATVTVKVDDAATLGDVLLLLSNIKISSELGDAVTAVGYNYATVNITDRIPGDINDDGKFDYYDVSKLYAFYRNKTTVADYIDTDINGSGGFDYYDVSKLYAIYRGKATFE